MKLAICLLAIWSLGSAAATPLLPASAGTSDAEASAPGCADFLTQMGKKPAHAEYAGCSYAPDRQGKPLEATYRVSGRFAAATEAYLIKAVGLNRLKRSCCIWDSPASQFRDSMGRDFLISMVSEETMVSSRSEWPRIVVFEITVETFTEEM
ncbi:hypothetical protein FHX15_001746 [Rhizobium sp. BK650]|uniref:DUF4952 domain-containing protein n=1 Tax=Rhizobium sp. BK650 TaxID=2586990 RepID=UPI0016082F89|nr:DUF4952 domain-containing protein [Rhizobium sp. BK650]MBB3656518.1 hypothetical protein [Rhizobium sp. BK650]